MTRCALCRCHHENTTVCDDCAANVADDIDSDPEGVGNGVAQRLREILRDAGCDVAVTRIDEVRAFRATPDVATVSWDRDYVPMMGEVTT